jgi:hypothetical protein
MERVLPGELDPEQADALEGEQAEGQVEWEARDRERDQGENVCVLVVERLLPIRRGCRVTSGVALNAVQ